MNQNFWHGKRVFVTGHTGFKGSWLILWLHRLGAETLGYALPPPTEPSLFRSAGLEAVGRTVTADVRDAARLGSEMREFAPDIVMHLAAQSVVLSSYEDPLETFSTNVMGTASVLNAVRMLGNRCAVVNVTTDKVYENQRWVWGYRENDPLGGRDPYSASKACAELVARAFRNSYFAGTEKIVRHIGIASARAGNVVGGGDWTPHQLIPDTVAALERGQAVVLRNPTAIRPWQHVLDCLSGYLTLAEALYERAEQFAGEWNFGPSDADMQPVSRVVELLAAPWGIAPAWTRDPAAYPHEEMELKLNSQKAIRELRWACRLSLETSIWWTADWFRRHARGQSARRLSEEQIDRYMQIGANPPGERLA